jgi:outer membrane murein-binding lipoprotein Lpp
MSSTLQLYVNPQEYGLDETKATTISEAFKPKELELEGYTNLYTSIINSEITPELTKDAAELKKKLVKVRTSTADIHKAEKAFYFAGGKFVDAKKNKITTAVEEMEAKLLAIANYYENIEKERIAKLQAERLEAISPYLEEAASRDWASMEQDVFDSYLATTKKKWEVWQAELEKQRKEEEEAKKAQEELLKAQQAEIEKQRAENEKLRKAAQEAQAKIDALAAEEKKKQQEAAKLAKASVNEQLTAWVDSFTLPTTQVSNDTQKDIVAKFEAFKKWAKEQINK